ncbi:MAG: hypothetical protein KKD73_01665 [Proteobacteria bacterium]|nr:hypothetical protein [Pseudomonadota bacterium]MBU1640078.1 hypothetical protein [Pseudomonadota bacterium]
MLTALTAAIIADLALTFPTLPSCAAWPHLARKIAIPALFVELTEMVAAADPGTEQLALTARFTAWIVFDRSQADDHLQAANLAAAVAHRIYKASRFGLTVGPASITHLGAADFKPELIGYTVWAVEWSHEIRLGDSIWDGTGIIPTEIWMGITPLTGTGNEAEYVEVTDV